MKVCVIGTGQMGKTLAEVLHERGDEVHISREITSTCPPEFDVLIDFSHPANLQDILTYGCTHQMPIVIATTGYTDEQYETIVAASQQLPILYSGNYSLGVIVMQQLVRAASNILSNNFDIEIIEKHHNKKIDAPSGTAKMLLEAAKPSAAYDVINGRVGTAKRGAKEIGVHAIRGGTIVGEHEVLFAGDDEVLSIKHEAASKSIFAKGAIHGAEWLIDKPVGLYSMEDVLFGASLDGKL